MLDISSTFDTLDHQILLSRLHLLGVRDLSSSCVLHIYLTVVAVNIYNSFSSPSPMKYGVPQGSVLGHSHFYIYLYPLPSIIYKYPNIYYQLYMFLLTNSSPGLNKQLSNCVNDIKEWIIFNNLYLNTYINYVVEYLSITNLIPSFSY